MDIIGWQYARGRNNDIAWLLFMKWGAFQGAERQLIVTAVAPLLLVILLWMLGRYTWARLESVKPEAVAPESLRTPLEDRRMWNGQGPVARLRSVHISFGIGLIGLAVLAPLLLSSEGLGSNSHLYASAWGWTVPTVGGGLVVLLVALILLVLLPSMSDRQRAGKAADFHSAGGLRPLPWIALALTLLAAAVLLIPGVWDSVYPNGTSGSLPGIVTAIEILFAVQGGLIALLAAVTWILVRAVSVDPAAEVPTIDNSAPANLRPPWFGMTPAVLSTFGWLLGASWAAAACLFVVKSAGGDVVSSAVGSSSLKAMIVPAPFVWAAAAAALVAVLGAVLVTLIGLSYAQRRQLSLDTHIDAAYAGATELPPERMPSTARFQRIRSAWLLGGTAEFAESAIGSLVLVMWVAVVVGVAGYVLNPALISSYAISYKAGALVILVIGAGTVWFGRRAYADPGTRKVMGILWDVGSFWPRATHPLAPPCYAERAIPDLTRRIEYYCGQESEIGRAGGMPSVVLSCHSQGSVIGAATVLQLTFDDSAKLSLLTYGCPLRRLHARCFPAYFGPTTLCRLGIFVRCGAQAKETPITAALNERRRWRWRNLYRPTDPIGGPVFVARRVQRIPPEAAPDDVDWNLRDPLDFDLRADNTSYEPARGHSDYHLDPGYGVALEAVVVPRSPPRGSESNPCGGSIRWRISKVLRGLRGQRRRPCARQNS